MSNIAKEHRKVKRLSYTLSPSTGCVSTYTSRVTWDLHAQRWPSFSILKAGGHRKINSASSPPLTALEIQPFVKTSACWCQHSALSKLKLLVPSKRSKRSDISESCFCLFFTESLRVTDTLSCFVCLCFSKCKFWEEYFSYEADHCLFEVPEPDICFDAVLTLDKCLFCFPVNVVNSSFSFSSTCLLFLTRLRIQRLI